MNHSVRYAGKENNVNVSKNSDTLVGYVGLFFVVCDELLVHTCATVAGECFGDFVNYPDSHDDVWQSEYFRKYNVDYDYFPRGRMIYNKTTGIYLIYHDQCAEEAAKSIGSHYPKGKCVLALDEHYQCHKCNPYYSSVQGKREYV